ncbi:MAG: SDR family oxidoreductase [Kiritimatiellae bacterium]|nr:SDR family oxidoreductase [Kiritimatiellia bacterium]
MSEKRALVAGGAGFLGSHLCERLLADGYSVVALDNLHTGSEDNLVSFRDRPRFEFRRQNVIDPLAGEFDEIYSLACPASPVHYQADPIATWETSVLGVRNLLKLSEKCGARLLHASTSEIYGDPLMHPQEEHYWGNVNTIGIRSCYDEGKRAAETLIADYRRVKNVDARMVRIFNTYGPRMHPQDGRVVSNFIMQALHDRPITIYGDGTQTRSFQYVDDLIRAMRLFMDKPRDEVDGFFARHKLGTPVLNTGNPGEYTMKQLAEEVLRLIPDSRSQIVYEPLPADDPKKRKPDITLAKELLGWEPQVPLSEGLKSTIAYFVTR